MEHCAAKNDFSNIPNLKMKRRMQLNTVRTGRMKQCTKRQKEIKGFSWMPRSNTKGREKRKLYGGNGEIQVSKRGNPHEKRTKRTETS